MSLPPASAAVTFNHAQAIVDDGMQPRLDGQGTPETAWRAWPSLQDTLAWPLDAWLPFDGCLVVVAPHPDDEVLACGGLLQAHAARGGSVLVVAVTDGEASHPGSATWTPAALGAHRRREAAAGLLRLAPAARHAHLALPDGHVQAHGPQLLEALQDLLSPSDRVLSTWRGDGHPDHRATALAAAQASTHIGCTFIEAPVWMWHWAQPSDARVPWQRLRGFALGADAQAAKQQALQAHASQLTQRDSCEGPVLGAQMVLRAARGTEYFFVQ